MSQWLTKAAFTVVRIFQEQHNFAAVAFPDVTNRISLQVWATSLSVLPQTHSNMAVSVHADYQIARELRTFEVAIFPDIVSYSS